MNWDSFNGWLGNLLTLLALLGGWLGVWIANRRVELRREEVLAWANDAIACMQTISLLAHPSRLPISREIRLEKFGDLAIEASVLIEKGRLFFKNQVVDDFGGEKEPAYRGYRPLILDELLVAHELACSWHLLTPDDQERASRIAETCERRFLSLVQNEVGRERTASNYTKEGGDGAHFHSLLAQLKRGQQPWRQEIFERRSPKWARWLNRR